MPKKIDINELLSHRPDDAIQGMERTAREAIQKAFSDVDIEPLHKAKQKLSRSISSLQKKLDAEQKRYDQKLKTRTAALKKWEEFLPKLETLLKTHKVDIPKISHLDKSLSGHTMIEKLYNLNPSRVVLIDGAVIGDVAEENFLNNVKEDLFSESVKLEELRQIIDRKVQIYHELLSGDTGRSGVGV